METTRRDLLGSVIAFGVAASHARAQFVSRFREYSRCLPDYLESAARDAYNRRNRRVAALATPEAIRQYAAWARTTFVQLAGGLPERTPLNTRVTGSFERDGYRVEKLVYESQPQFFVTANLYLPERGAPPFPAVLVQMGHSANGKSYALYQRLCQGLARLGYVVLGFDPMGQGERTNYPRPGGWLTRLPGPDDEHTAPGRQMLLIGDTATRMQVWDAIRSLDVLASHPQVDPKRLASTGQSGGGTLTMMLAAVDDRLAAAAACCGNTENFATLPFRSPGSTDDAEQDFIASAPAAFDRWDLLWPFAPKPLLLAGSAHDFAGVYSASYEESGREEFAKLQRGYATLGASSHLRAFETPLPHSLSYPLRMAVYNWFERHLKGGPEAITAEPPTSPESDDTLWCGPTGNATRDFGGRTAFALTAARARAIQTPERLPDLRQVLGMDALPPAPKLDVLARTRFASCDVVAVEVITAAKVWTPAWVYLPKTSWTRLILALEPGGRNTRWGEDGLWAQLAGAGTAVCAADVRGIGDLRPEFSPGAPGYARRHQSEESYAWASLMIGRSLLGQRTTDTLGIVQALARAYPHARILIAARDGLTVPALCATAIESRVSAVYLSNHLASWRSLVESERYTCPTANLIWDVLRVTDLPQIARSVAPRNVIVAGALDATGALLPQAPYASYRPNPGWDAAAFADL